MLRLIEMMGALVQRIMGRIADGRSVEAIELADDAIGELTGLPVGTVDAMNGAGLVAFLSAGRTLDVDVASALGELMVVRADAREALAEHEAAERDRERARALVEAVGER